MAVATHPTPETLSAFACGALPPAELAQVSDHVRACGVCCSILARMPEDTLAGLARSAARAAAATPAPVASLDVPAVTGIPPALVTHPRYKVLSELGAGGMGTVYKAEHRVMGRIVALKVVSPQLTAKTSAVERFRKEIQAAARLNHPNIVTAHDADEAEGLHFLVMEYVEGTSLDRLVHRKGPLTVSMAAQFTRQAALGLQHAHEKGMVHRDIKPQNLMVTRKAQVKILDFGLARFAHTDEPEDATPGRVPFGAGKPVVHDLTNPNLLMGTPDYLSPEQAKNSHAVDTRSDIYSLGCTLYFLLTGKPPFAHASTLIDKLLAHTEEEPKALCEVRPEVPEGLAAVVAKMMAKNPDDRYTLPSEAAAALQPFTRAVEAPADTRVTGAGFEVVDAVVITPAPPERPAAAFDFETGPIPDGATVVEPVKPRKVRKSKKAVPWWKRKWAKIGAAAAALLLLVVVVANANKNKTPPTDDTANNNLKPQGQPTPQQKGPLKPQGQPTPQPKGPLNPWLLGSAPGTLGKDTLPVLFVVPSNGVYGPDYFPVVARLRAEGVKVVTASGEGQPASVMPPHDANGRTVPVDVKLGEVDPARYSAILFCGAEIEEYVYGKYLPSGPLSTKRVLGEMKTQNKPIGAICLGQGVLAVHGILKDKPVARSQAMQNKFPGISKELTWVDKCVVTAPGKIITAGGPQDATAFADAVLAAIQ